MNDLEKITQEWMQLERKTLAQRKEAELFYDENLMGLIEMEFIRNNKAKVTEKVSHLIISVGTSYEPIVLSISLFRPQKILFLYTKESGSTLNKIVSYCQLDMTSFQKREVQATSPMDIYRFIKEAYLIWGRPGKLYIDFTGGTKAMSAAAAMAGAVIDTQIVYVGTTNYLSDFRKPYPGSERLYYIDNPLSVFGDLEVEKAMVLFAQCNYPAAREKLGILKDQIPDPNLRQQLSFLYTLAVMYEHWDALEFEPAFEAALTLERELKRDCRLHPTFILMDSIARISRQKALLEALCDIPGLIREKRNFEILKNSDYMYPLMFTMYLSALLREQQEKYDMATLLMYRLLEMIEQRRLSLYNLYISRMVYEDTVFVSPDQLYLNDRSGTDRREWLKDQVFAVKKNLFPRTESRYLPEQLSLLEGYILLSVLRDTIICNNTVSPINRLRQIRSMVYLRNNSIFAHGLGPVSRTDYIKFKGFVEQIFRDSCMVEGIDFDNYLDDIRWIDPTRSEFYSRPKV